MLRLLLTAARCARGPSPESADWGSLQAQEQPTMARSVVAQQPGGAEEVQKRMLQVKIGRLGTTSQQRASSS